MAIRLRLGLTVLLVTLLLGGCGASQATAPVETPSQEVSQMLEEGRDLLERGETDAAITVLEQVVAADPSLAEAHFLLGNAFTRAGRLEGAEEAFRSALELRADDADALSNLGVVLYQMGKLPEAVKQFEKAARLMPDDAEIQYNLGGAFFAQGKVDEAIKAFEAAREKEPDLAEVYLGLGYAYKEQGDMQRAIEAFRRFLELSDDVGWKTKAQEELRVLEGK